LGVPRVMVCPAGKQLRGVNPRAGSTGLPETDVDNAGGSIAVIWVAAVMATVARPLVGVKTES